MQLSAAPYTDYKSLYEQQCAVNKELQLTVASLTRHLEQLRKMIFGSRSERFVPVVDPPTASAQLSLGLEAATIAQCNITDATRVTYIRTKTALADTLPKAHPGRMQLPEHLRREVILLQPDMDVTGLKKIGDEVSEVLDYTPGELYVKQYIRPKYVQPLDELTNTVLSASLPNRIMNKCLAGEGLLAQIVVDKYTDHLPLHRQLQRFERVGVSIAPSTINDWVSVVLLHLTALWEKLSIYTTNALLHIDNNPVENAIRPVAIGRKNYLFAGSHQAAQRAAMIYSLFATCRLHHINPYDWLKDVLQRMHLYTTNNIAELLPHKWKKTLDSASVM